MAKIPLVPIGRARDAFLDAATFEKNKLAMHALDEMLGARRAKVAKGWGDEYVARVHKKEKLTARERIARLRHHHLDHRVRRSSFRAGRG